MPDKLDQTLENVFLIDDQVLDHQFWNVWTPFMIGCEISAQIPDAIDLIPSLTPEKSYFTSSHTFFQLPEKISRPIFIRLETNDQAIWTTPLMVSHTKVKIS